MNLFCYKVEEDISEDRKALPEFNGDCVRCEYMHVCQGDVVAGKSKEDVVTSVGDRVEGVEKEIDTLYEAPEKVKKVKKKKKKSKDEELAELAEEDLF